ncbi:MAG: YbaK/EbsC family protein [Candidatus Promineifilaceae bacterium]
MHPSAQKVVDAAQELGLTIEVAEFEQTTRTADEAAAAIGCEVAQIVKSLCFSVNNEPVMALVSGANLLDERKLAALRGVGRKKVKRARAEMVKEATGFSIGGVPPFGHVSPMPIFIDQDLTNFEVVWAAAGTHNTVFPIQSADLLRASGGILADLKVDG